MTGGIVLTPNTTPRDRILLGARGIIAETFDPRVAGSSTQLITQRMYAGLVAFKAGDVVSGFASYLQSAGSGLTLGRFGLYDTTGALLCSTASDTAIFSGSTGAITKTASSSYTITADGAYYLAVLVVGTTTPNLLRGASLADGGKAIGSGVRPYTDQSSVSDLPSTATFAGPTNFSFYVAATGTFAS